MYSTIVRLEKTDSLEVWCSKRPYESVTYHPVQIQVPDSLAYLPRTCPADLARLQESGRDLLEENFGILYRRLNRNISPQMGQNVYGISSTRDEAIRTCHIENIV